MQHPPPSNERTSARDAAASQQRRMKRGRWVEEADAPSGVRKDRVFSVRLTVAELAEFDAAIQAAGLSRNRAIRIAARQIGGFIEADPETLGTLRDMQRQLSGIATNVNQIARAANRSHDPDYVAFERSRAALGKELARVSSQLRAMMDHAQRRSDGLERLRRGERAM